MLMGMRHLHQTMAYLVLFSSVLSLILVFAGAASKPGLAKIMKISSQYGLMMLGRLVLIVGLGMTHPLNYSYGATWIWMSFLLWVPIEIVGKRFVKAGLSAVADGGEATSKLLPGAAIQLVCVVAIIGLMTVRP
jgi:hypothetical protein